MTTKDIAVVSLMNTKKVLPSGDVIDDEGKYRAYLKVHTDDLDALSPSDKVEWMDEFGQMLRTFTGDLKVIAATTRVNTNEQQVYYRQLLIDSNRHLSSPKVQQNERELTYWQKRRQLASEVIERDETISQTSDDLNFYFVIFADTEKELRNEVNLIMRSGGQTFKLQKLNAGRVETVMKRVSNLNVE